MMGDMIKNGVHASSREEKYIWPADPLIRERLEWFQDQKLALFIHWGPCSQIGIDSSWALSDGDAHWSRKGMDWEPDPVAFRAQYHDMAKCFNPIRFNPDRWADFARENGFKYLLFTRLAADNNIFLSKRLFTSKSHHNFLVSHTHTNKI
jgi:alpha-L-fucosidase